jgi:hypothetical protein
MAGKDKCLTAKGAYIDFGQPCKLRLALKVHKLPWSVNQKD